MSAVGIVKRPMSPWWFGATCAEAAALPRHTNNPRSALRLAFMHSPFASAGEPRFLPNRISQKSPIAKQLYGGYATKGVRRSAKALEAAGAGAWDSVLTGFSPVRGGSRSERGRPGGGVRGDRLTGGRRPKKNRRNYGNRESWIVSARGSHSPLSCFFESRVPSPESRLSGFRLNDQRHLVLEGFHPGGPANGSDGFLGQADQVANGLDAAAAIDLGEGLFVGPLDARQVRLTERELGLLLDPGAENHQDFLLVSQYGGGVDWSRGQRPDRVARAHLDQATGDQSVEDLRRFEGGEADRSRQLLDGLLAVDLDDHVPLGRGERHGFRGLPRQQDRHMVDPGDLPREDFPLVQPPSRFHQQAGVGLLDRNGVWFLSRRELEVSRGPDRQGVNGLLTRQLAQFGVNHLPVLQVDVAPLRASDQGEHARLS